MNFNIWRAGTIAAMMLFATVATAGSMNKSVRIDDGQTADGASTVNGSIRVGDAATVTGDLETVNGSITVGAGSTAYDVETVNGKIRIDNDASVESASSVNGKVQLGERVTVKEGISTVNGVLAAEAGSRIGGDVEAVNGAIRLYGVSVGGDVKNNNGGMELMNGTDVQGSLIVRKSRGSWSQNRRNPRIVIGRDVRIRGDLVFEREVDLYVHETAEIGNMTGVDVKMERYDGDRP